VCACVCARMRVANVSFALSRSSVSYPFRFAVCVQVCVCAYICVYACVRVCVCVCTCVCLHTGKFSTCNTCTHTHSRADPRQVHTHTTTKPQTPNPEPKTTNPKQRHSFIDEYEQSTIPTHFPESYNIFTLYMCITPTPKPQTLITNPLILNNSSYTLSPNLSALNPKLTHNPKPYTCASC